ncbi:hypothetical protein ACVWY2_008807 [Bradyrhizobium sp. JR6.1]
MACHRAAGRGEASALANRTSTERFIGCHRLATRPQFRPPFAGCISILVGARTAPHWATPSCSIDRNPASAHPRFACSRWVAGGQQLSQHRARPVWQASHSGSRLENTRSAQPDHSPGPDGAASHAGRLSRIAPSQGQGQVTALPELLADRLVVAPPCSTDCSHGGSICLGFTWDRKTKLADDRLAQPRILHPWLQQRFAVTCPAQCRRLQTVLESACLPQRNADPAQSALAYVFG